MAQNPNPSQLDPGQIVKRVFDTDNDRIRVDAAITAPDGTSVLIDATTDSIKIGNTATGPFLNINSDGSTNTNLQGLNVFQTNQYTINNTSVQLTPSPLSTRTSISIKVTTTSSADAVYIGNSNSVTTSTGYPLFDGDILEMDLTSVQNIWAIGTSSGQLVFTLELGD